METELDECGSQADSGRAGSRTRSVVSCGADKVLPVAQGGTPDRSSGTLRNMVYGTSPGAVPHAKEPKKSGTASFADREKSPQSEPVDRLDVGAGVGIHRCERPELFAAIRSRIFEYRLRALHRNSR